MGTQEDRDWLDVANDLLSKCFINLRLKKVTDCDGDVFVALYEAILGEKVPDYIAAPKTQEDDVHNVQSVIDSLALDYLQISLSHITGENIVRGDKESIKNLLEIFDGLLEYLTEQISEDDLPHEGEPDGVPHEQVTPAPKPTKELSVELEKLENLSLSSIRSSKHSPPSWSADGSESTAELIRLGDSAQTFVAKQQVSLIGRMNGFHQPNRSSSKLLESSSLFRKQVCADPAHTGASLQKEPLCAAIPLQPPYQTTPQRLDRPCHSGTQSPASVPSQRGGQQGDMPLALAAHACSQNSQSSRPLSNSILANGIQSPHHPLEQSEMCASVERGAKLGTEKEPAEVSGTRSRRVVFRTQPDVHVPTLRGRSSDSSLEGEEDDKSSSSSRRCCRHCRGQSVRTALCERHMRVREGPEEPLTQRTQRNRLAEQELHHMSERLAHRLEELDQMLKRALGESVETSGTREEDKQSHHSDSCMEFSRTQTHTGMSPAPKPPRTRSLSPSPPPVRRSLEPQLEAALVRDTQKHMAQIGQEELQELENQRRLGRLVGKSYEQELRGFEEKERRDIEKARRQAQEAEREYRETIWKDIAGTPKPFHVSKVGQQHRAPRPRHVVHGRGRALPRKAAPMQVKDNNLLPVLLEEFPHLQLSPHALTCMWKQQLKQVDRLTAQSEQRNHIKLANQVAEAQKRHDLLVGIIRKEQEHNQRLRDFRERIQQQKSAQNKLREQRQQVARARKYHNDYHVQLRARLMRARTREERMFRRAFEEGLELQKEQLREQQAYAREQRQEHQRRHRDELQSMENYYRDQFSLLAEALAQERHEIQVRKKAQEKVLQKMKRDLRSKMEREIRELQKIIIQNDDDDFFWELDLERLQKRVRMASFQYHNGHHT